MFLRVTRTTRVGRALRSRKLSPKFFGSYQISRRIEPVAYEIALPPQLANLHPVFHVSQMRKYVSDPAHVLEAHLIQPFYFKGCPNLLSLRVGPKGGFRPNLP